MVIITITVLSLLCWLFFRLGSLKVNVPGACPAMFEFRGLQTFSNSRWVCVPNPRITCSYYKSLTAVILAITVGYDLANLLRVQSSLKSTL